MNKNICVISKSLIFTSGIALWISLTYIKNKRGPSTDPYGTPHLISFTSELLLPIAVNCFLFLK